MTLILDNGSKHFFRPDTSAFCSEIYHSGIDEHAKNRYPSADCSKQYPPFSTRFAEVFRTEFIGGKASRLWIARRFL